MLSARSLLQQRSGRGNRSCTPSISAQKSFEAFQGFLLGPPLSKVIVSKGKAKNISQNAA